MRFNKTWIAAVVAILGMANSASAQLSYSISEVATSGSLTGAAGSSVTVQLYLNETVGKDGSSIINAQGIASYALGINGTGGTSTITAVSNASFQTPTGGPNNYTYSNGISSASAGNSAFVDAVPIAGAGFSPGSGLQNSGSQNGANAALTSGIYLGSVTITIGTGQTTYTIGSAYANAPGITAPQINTGANDNTLAGQNNLWTNAGGPDPDSGQTYTGVGDMGPVTFTVGQAAAVPEPSSMALCGLAICGMGAGAWRRRKAKLAAEAGKVEEVAAI